MTRVLSIFCLLALMLVVYPEPAKGAPTVLVRDRSDIHLDPIQRMSRSAQVRGQVVFRSTSMGVPSAIVRIDVDDDTVNVVADDFGWFTFTLDLSDGDHTIEITFEGSDLVDASWAKIESFNFVKGPVLLALDLPTEIADTETAIGLSFTTTTNDLPVPIEVEVYFGQAGKLRKVGSVRSNAEGAGSYAISSEFFPSPGRYRCELRFPGNQELDAALTNASTTISATSNLVLFTERANFALGEALVVEGRLSDGLGVAIPNAAIALEINSQHLSDSQTDKDGKFRFSVDTEELGSGSSTVQAIYTPNESWNSPGRSKPLTVVIGQRRAISIRSTLLAFAITTIALLTFVGLRTKPWKKWIKSKEPSDKETSDEREELPLSSGLTTARTKLGGALRRASEHGFSGTVLSSSTKRVIPGVEITFPSIPVGANVQPIQSNAEGCFESVSLAEGSYTVRLVATGFVREEFSISIPHRGEFTDTTVKLLPVKEKIFSMYKQAVQNLLPKAGLWGIWTPRQILDYARENQPSPSLSDLTDFVEETFFSQRTPGEELLEVAANKIKRLDSHP
ncbi:MAG: hypothetical protein JKY56_10860 [Kofleriaceae bacterium]|nr:hypothetical protein [Kofleriaceae bacterium]